MASPFISPITDPLTNTATYATYSQIEQGLKCVLLSVTLTNVNEMGEKMTKVNKWGIWREKREKSIVGLEKMSYLCTVKRHQGNTSY